MTPPSQPPADSPLRASGLSDGLLPCPFCGGEAEFQRRGTARQSCIVACTDCGAQLESNEAEWSSGRCWNTRAARLPVAEGTDSPTSPADELLEKIEQLPEAIILPEGAGEPTDGVALIRAERQRQISAEGWTPEHDDTHAHGEMALAAACYAWPNPRPVAVKRAWPWDRAWWKPATPGDRIGFPEQHTREEITAARIKDLRRAGALIAAEIDRLRRAAPDPVHQEPADGE